MTTPSADQVLTLRDFLLPHIEASRHMAHQLIATIPTDVLAICPVAEGESIGELAWTVASSYDVLLSGLCEGQFPTLPAMPADGTAASFVAWDQASVVAKLRRAAALGADELLRPLTLAHITQPAIGFLPLFMGNVAQHLGVLSAWLQLHMPAPAASGELSDADLANVAGGVGGVGTFWFGTPSVLPQNVWTVTPLQQLPSWIRQNQSFPGNGPGGAWLI